MKVRNLETTKAIKTLLTCQACDEMVVSCDRCRKEFKDKETITCSELVSTWEEYHTCEECKIYLEK